MMTRLILLSSMILGLAACGDNSLDVYLKNRRGISQTKAQQLSTARESFVDAMSVAPFQPELHLNLGVIDGALGRVDAAEAGYLNAEHYAAENPALLFAARFNMGEIEGKSKKIDSALKWYQAALDLDPTSLEAKTNIELLLGGKGGGEGQDDKKDQDQKGDKQQDKKDGQGDDKDKKDDKDKDQQQQKEHAKNSPKYKPREFKGELSENDVKKILGEIRQQEKKIRSEFNRREAKEKPRDKDW